MILALVSMPAIAAAQTTSAPVTAGWQDGFVLQSADGAYRLVLGATVQVDGGLIRSVL